MILTNYLGVGCDECNKAVLMKATMVEPNQVDGPMLMVAPHDMPEGWTLDRTGFGTRHFCEKCSVKGK